MFPILVVAAMSFFAAVPAQAKRMPSAAENKVREACRADRQKFCGHTKPGRETMACMKKHAGELSAECKNEVKNLKEFRRR